MKKSIALAIIAVFVLSLIPLAYAEETTNVRKALGIREDIKDKKEDAKDNAMERKSLAEAKRQENLQRIIAIKEQNKAKLAALDAEKLDKIVNLSKERIDKIAELDKQQIERLSELDKDKLEKVSDLSHQEIEKLSSLGREKLKIIANLDAAQIKAKLNDLKIVKAKTGDDLDRRKIPKEKLAQLKEKFENAKEKFKAVKTELTDERQKLKDATEKGNSEEALAHAKAYLLKTADALINHLEKLKAKVQESANIPDAREKQIVTEIDAQITEVTAIKAEIEAAATKEQIKESAKKLHAVWSRLKHIIKLHAERVISARVEGIVNRGIVLEKRLDTILQKLKDRGIEVDASAEVASFSEKIALAKDKYTQAQAKLSEALDLRAKAVPADSEKINQLTEEAKELLKQSRDAVKEAHEILKLIVKKIREAAPETDLSEEVEVEVSQEVSAADGNLTLPTATA